MRRHIPIADLVSTPEPFLFGLAPNVLDFAERYFGLPVDYLGVDIKREIANGVEDSGRFWHYDIEDARILKLMVYLDRYSMTYSYASKAAYVAFQVARDSQAAFVSRWGSMLDRRQLCAAAPHSVS